MSGFERFIYLIFLKNYNKKNLQIALKVVQILSGFERFIYPIFLKNHNKKKPSNCFKGLWGIVWIRTFYLSTFSKKSQHKKTFELLWRFVRHRPDSNVLFIYFFSKITTKKTFKLLWRFVRHRPDSNVLFIQFFSKITTQKNLQIALKVCEASSGFERFIYLIFLKNYNTKKPSNCFEGLWGIVRIRTGVGAFAEPSLATRPRRHYLFGLQK